MHRIALCNIELSSPKCPQCWGWQTLPLIHRKENSQLGHNNWGKSFHPHDQLILLAFSSPSSLSLLNFLSGRPWSMWLGPQGGLEAASFGALPAWQDQVVPEGSGGGLIGRPVLLQHMGKRTPLFLCLIFVSLLAIRRVRFQRANWGKWGERGSGSYIYSGSATRETIAHSV